MTRRSASSCSCAARGVLSAAVRLGVVGPLRGAAAAVGVAGVSATVLARYRDADVRSTLAQTAPFIDILQGAHDRLYSRLFQS